MSEESSEPGQGPVPFQEGAAVRAWRWLKKWGVLILGVIIAILTMGLAGNFAISGRNDVVVVSLVSHDFSAGSSIAVRSFFTA